MSEQQKLQYPEIDIKQQQINQVRMLRNNKRQLRRAPGPRSSNQQRPANKSGPEKK